MREVGKGDERGGYEGRCEECVDSFLENSVLKANKHMTHEKKLIQDYPVLSSILSPTHTRWSPS